LKPLKNRKISILHYSCPPVIGGAEYIVESQARLFHKYGADVRILVGQGNQFHDDIPVYQLEQLSSDHPRRDRINQELLYGEDEAFHEAVREIEQMVEKRLNGDNTWIIHNFLTMPFNLPATQALRNLVERTSAQVFPWTHDIAWLDDEYQLSDYYPENLLKKPAPVTAYVVISEYRKRQLRNVFDSEETPELKVIPDAVDVGEFHQLDPIIENIYRDHQMYRDDIVAIYPTRIVKRKNIELSLQIVNELKQMGNNIHFVITGPPDPHNPSSRDYFENLLDMRERLNLKKQVIFCYELEDPLSEGPLEISYNRIRQLYRISDLLLMTPREEGFGIPLLEAAVSRLRVCCPDIGPLREIGRDAPVYFDPGETPVEIARRIQNSLEEDTNYQFQRRTRQEYTWPAVYERQVIPMLNQTFPLQSGTNGPA